MTLYGLSANSAAGGNKTGQTGAEAGLWREAARYGAENPVALALFVLLAVILLAAAVSAFFYLGRRKKKEASDMASQTRGERAETFRVGKLHEQGERSSQQDCFGVSDESLTQTRGLLAVVADGMGGLSDGDKVSETAVRAVLDGFAMYQGKCTPEQLLLMLAKQAVDGVNGFLGPSNLHKSGSTLVMGLVRDGAFSFLSVGDSRVCLYRGGILMQLNREHIFRNKLALDAVNGTLPLQEVYTDSRGGGLTSFLGMGALAYLDTPPAPLELLAGDKIILMSDGVYNALEEGELAECLEADLDGAVERLGRAIREKGYTNQDNYTAVIVECGGRALAASLPRTEEPG